MVEKYQVTTDDFATRSLAVLSSQSDEYCRSLLVLGRSARLQDPDVFYALQSAKSQRLK
jgi:hypothetical protein